jgi:hypothetical protein
LVIPSNLGWRGGRGRSHSAEPDAHLPDGAVKGRTRGRSPALRAAAFPD